MLLNIEWRGPSGKATGEKASSSGQSTAFRCPSGTHTLLKVGRAPPKLASRPVVLCRGQKNRTRKKTNSWERRFPGTFRTNVPLILPIFSVFSVGEGKKFPGTLFLETFFSYFRWFSPSDCGNGDMERSHSPQNQEIINLTQNQGAPNPPEFAQPRLSRVKARSSPARGYKFGRACSYMAGHYPGIFVTCHIGTNTPKFVPLRWGRPRLDPTQTGLCKFGWVWSSLTKFNRPKREDFTFLLIFGKSLSLVLFFLRQMTDFLILGLWLRSASTSLISENIALYGKDSLELFFGKRE